LSDEKLIYLYCITKTKPYLCDFKEMPIKIYPIYSQGIYAVVSKVSADEFSQNNLEKRLNDTEWLAKHAWRHEMVIEKIMRQATVVPFEFATIFRREENVEKLLKKRSLELKKIVSELDGKEEWGIKAYNNVGKLKDILQKEDEEIKRIDTEITSASRGKAYFLNKKRDKLIEKLTDNKILEYMKDSFERLKKISLKSNINRVSSKELTRKKDDMVLNAAFLINKKKIREFKSTLEHLEGKYQDKGFSFDLTGPWPSYSFCALREEEKQNE